MLESPAMPLEVLASHPRARALLHPLRLRILHEASQPVSASEIGTHLGMPRQRVNYHFRQLVRAGLLRAAGRRRKRNMFEKRYVASARGYLISPGVLGPARADWRSIGEARSPAYLMALLSNAEADLARLWSASATTPPEEQTISLKTQFRFRTGQEREAFARALREALSEVVVRSTGPAGREDGSPGPGRLHRLIVACYPYVPET